MPSSPKVTIAIPTYNRDEDLVRSISSVLLQKFKDYELIIVDQTLNHKDTTVKFLNGIRDKRVRYFKVTPPSLPAARNFAIGKSRSNIIIFIDDDVELDPDFIINHLNSYEDRKVGSVAGRVRGITEPEAKVLYKLTPSGKRIGAFNYTNKEEAMSARGCNMSFRVSLLKNIGGFDTNYTSNAYREDTDISFRVRQLGYIILFQPTASLKHYDAPTGGCREQAGLFNKLATFKNNFRFFYKNQPIKFLPLFYLTHLTRIIPSKNPLISLKRLYYLNLALIQAKIELRHINKITTRELID